VIYNRVFKPNLLKALVLANFILVVEVFWVYNCKYCSSVFSSYKSSQTVCNNYKRINLITSLIQIRVGWVDLWSESMPNKSQKSLVLEYFEKPMVPKHIFIHFNCHLLTELFRQTFNKSIKSNYSRPLIIFKSLSAFVIEIDSYSRICVS